MALMHVFLLAYFFTLASTSPIALGEWVEEIEYQSTTSASTSTSVYSSNTSSLEFKYEEASSSASAIILEIQPSSDGWIIAIKYGGIGGGSGKYIARFINNN